MPWNHLSKLLCGLSYSVKTHNRIAGNAEVAYTADWVRVQIYLPYTLASRGTEIALAVTMVEIRLLTL